MFEVTIIDPRFRPLIPTHTLAARENMLMRFSKVTPEGEYVPPPPANSKASFSTMTYVRALIVEDAGEFLGRAVTIAVRGGLI